MSESGMLKADVKIVLITHLVDEEEMDDDDALALLEDKTDVFYLKETNWQQKFGLNELRQRKKRNN